MLVARLCAADVKHIEAATVGVEARTCGARLNHDASVATGLAASRVFRHAVLLAGRLSTDRPRCD